MSKTIQLYIPMKMESELNKKEHWGSAASRHKKQKELVENFLKPFVGYPTLPCTVELIRCASRPLDKDDNLPASFKWVKDSIAGFLIPGLAAGRADDDERITWIYDFIKTRRIFSGCMVRILCDA